MECSRTLKQGQKILGDSEEMGGSDYDGDVGWEKVRKGLPGRGYNGGFSSQAGDVAKKGRRER